MPTRLCGRNWQSIMQPHAIQRQAPAERPRLRAVGRGWAFASVQVGDTLPAPDTPPAAKQGVHDRHHAPGERGVIPMRRFLLDTGIAGDFGNV